jgi:hypothetical protein
MAGCKSCSGCSDKPYSQPINKAEKLEKAEKSGNPRYPHIFEGNQAIYVNSGLQMIVTVVHDLCDDQCDCFEILPQRVLRRPEKTEVSVEAFTISKRVSENTWKLQALL